MLVWKFSSPDGSLRALSQSHFEDLSARENTLLPLFDLHYIVFYLVSSPFILLLPVIIFVLHSSLPLFPFNLPSFETGCLCGVLSLFLSLSSFPSNYESMLGTNRYLKFKTCICGIVDLTGENTFLRIY